MNKLTQLSKLPLSFGDILTKAKKMFLMVGVLFFLSGSSNVIFSQNAPSWAFLGPGELIHNTVIAPNPLTGDSIPNSSSRIHDIAVVEGGDRAYLTKHMNGVWGSVNDATGWVKLYDPQIVTTQSPAAFDFFGIAVIGGAAADGSEDQIFANVAMPGYNTSTLQYSNKGQAGIAYSSDGGSTWEWQNLPYADQCTRIIPNPNPTPTSVAFAIGENIYEYNGSSWSTIYSGGSFHNVFVTNSGGSNVWYASKNHYHSTDFLYTSTDGKTWTSLPFTASDFAQTTYAGQKYININCQTAVAPDNPNYMFIYGAVGATNKNPTQNQGEVVNIYVYDLSNQTSQSLSVTGGYSIFQGYQFDDFAYDLFTVAPNESAVYVLNPERTMNRVDISGTFPNLQGTATQLEGIGWDPYSIKFTPKSTTEMWFGCDQGIYHSDNSTGSGFVFKSINIGMSGVLTNSIGQHPTQIDYILSSNQDDGLLLYRGIENSWVLQQADAFGCIFNWNNPSEVITTIDGSTYKVTIGRYPNSPDTDISPSGDYFSFSHPLETTTYNSTNPSDQTIGWGGVSRPHISTDFGTTWQSVPNDTFAWDANGTITTSALAMVSSTEFYAANTAGEIYQFSNSGGTWSQTSLDPSDQLPNYEIQDIEVVPGATNTMYVSLNRYLDSPGPQIWYYDGTNWSNVSGTIPSHTNFHTLAVNPNYTQSLWAGSDQGVYFYSSGTWIEYFQGMGNGAVRKLEFCPADSYRLRAAVWGKGIYELNLGN